MSDFGPFVQFSPDNVVRDYSRPPLPKIRKHPKARVRRYGPRKKKNANLQVSDPANNPRLRVSFKVSPKRPYRKRRISEIQRDSKYQRKLARRRGHYGRRVRKLKYRPSKKPQSANMIKSHDVMKKHGSGFKIMHIRAHARHPRGYNKVFRRPVIRDQRIKSI